MAALILSVRTNEVPLYGCVVCSFGIKGEDYDHVRCTVSVCSDGEHPVFEMYSIHTRTGIMRV